MFALLDQGSFVRPDQTVTRQDVGDPRPVRSAIPAARSPRTARSAPGALFTPVGAEAAGPPECLSVLVVDADPHRRAVVVGSLSGVGTPEVDEVGSVPEARARLRSGPPCDLAVVDLSLPDGPGGPGDTALDLVAELRAHGWRTVVLGGPGDPRAARDAFQAGALAYLLTSAPTAPGERRVVEPEASAAHVQGVDRSPHELSAREVQVLRCVADGRSNAEIGEDLTLSALTVKSHLSRIGRKLGTGDRAEMVALAMRSGVLD